MKKLRAMIVLMIFLFLSINCFAVTLTELNGLFVLKSVQQYNPTEGSLVKVTFNNGNTYGYGYFTLNKRFRIRIKYKGDGIDLNRDEIGGFVLNNDTIDMTIDATGKEKASTISLPGSTLTVETDFTDEPDKGYILTMELEKVSNVINKSSLNIVKGWNLLSVSNFIKPVEDFSSISNSLNTIWQWDATGGKWRVWSPDANIQQLISEYKLSSVKEVLAGEGFWVDAKENAVLPVDNYFSFSPEMIFILKTGWNLCGVVKDISPSELPDASNIKTVWQWDTTGGKWRVWSPDSNITKLVSDYKLETITTLKKLEGFWVNK